MVAQCADTSLPRLGPRLRMTFGPDLPFGKQALEREGFERNQHELEAWSTKENVKREAVSTNALTTTVNTLAIMNEGISELLLCRSLAYMHGY